MEEEPHFEALRARLRGTRPPIALIGAGASMPNYPDWAGLMTRLHARVEAHAPSAPASGAADERQDLGSWYASLKTFTKDPLWQAEAYEQALPPGGLQKFIAEEFGPDRGVTSTHQALARLPFRHYLTTNFDTSIERALRREKKRFEPFTWNSQKAVSNFLRTLHDDDAGRRVVYLHGRYNRPRSLVLTERTYVDRYVVNDDARRKLMAILLTYPVVFVGFSMDDPDLSQIMREVAARLGPYRASGAALPHHYAIFGYADRGEREVIRRRMEGKFGIGVIFYKVRDGQHSALAPLLQRLGGISPDLDAFVTELRRDDPADPQKGLWGGSPSAGGFTLDVEMLDQDNGEWVEFELRVTADSDPGFKGKVRFHLHDSFARSVVTVKVQQGVARLKRWSYGAFTAGAEVLDRGVKLELDLAERPEFPKWFRER